jgi:hypothetical protein
LSNLGGIWKIPKWVFLFGAAAGPTKIFRDEGLSINKTGQKLMPEFKSSSAISFTDSIITTTGSSSVAFPLNA